MGSELDAYLQSQGLTKVESEPQVEKPEETTEVPQNEEVKQEEVVQPNETPEVKKGEEKDVEQVSFEDQFKERYGSFDDLDNKIRSLEERKGLESKFAEEDVTRLEQLLEGGLSWDKIGEIAKIQNLDVDSLNDEQALAKTLELRDGLSKDEINYKLLEFKKLADVDLDLLDDEEKAAHFAKKAEFARLAEVGKGFLSGLKSDEKYTLPELASKQSPEEIAELQRKNQEEFEELQKLYEKGVDSTLSDSSSIKVNLGEGRDFEFELNDEMKQAVRKEMLSINDYHTNFEERDAQGNPTAVLFDKMFEERAKGVLFDKIIQSVYNSTVNDGTVEAVKDINNVTTKDKTTRNGAKPSVMDQIVKGYKKANGLD